MCLGIPMQVIESGEGVALCRAGDEVRRIDMLLVGRQPVGTWL
ncbi:MAG TPA: HypC/HybG/HupF family hydrogenase formation chaperone, partial [Chromatiales bacterium]|nr:HypC/HybG/HupF family hydrogenase formation chaperone [Chromatiales bacterium]